MLFWKQACWPAYIGRAEAFLQRCKPDTKIGDCLHLRLASILVILQGHEQAQTNVDRLLLRQTGFLYALVQDCFFWAYSCLTFSAVLQFVLPMPQPVLWF